MASSPTGPHLARFIRLIELAGPLPIARYMAEANTLYYASRDPLGRAGDFVTAPEISQMFGEMIGIWLADLAQRSGAADRCHYVELGPGRGSLASDALRTMQRFGATPQVHFIEGSPALQAIQAKVHPGALWHSSLDSVPTDGPLLIVANEFFDALPVHQGVKTDQGWRERVVIHDAGRLMPAAGQRPFGAALPSGFEAAEPGAIIETCPAANAIAEAISQRLAVQGGAALIIDYGYAEPMIRSTLQAVRDHQKVDPFADPGQCDLTALVDFAALAEAAGRHDALCHGPVGQGSWLMALGIANRAAALAKAKPESASQIMQDMKRLVDPDEMGTLFKVLAVTAAGWPHPAGFLPSA